ncbi:MAG: flavin reductase family protein [Thermogemmatispora sp.]|uniref:flavin reductase family protein n=1 Tax=Thermogemmatispora sp. TaxID=1968838 RepID=UPI00262B93F8|nr:flavin reductase family protein [Thermogemmatispora sp.]MBX5457475.1 flavin reductase family protein [Thermogemmatispora sp.]
MSIDREFFRHVLGQFATGVTVVTTRGSAGLVGLTVNAFCSVSLDPPLVLVCIDLKSRTLQAIRESQIFAVNILSEEQEELARCFALPSEERYRYFCHAAYHLGVTGAPLLEGTLAFVEARLVADYPGGDHAILLGEVVALGTADQPPSDRANAAANEPQVAGMGTLQDGNREAGQPGGKQPLAYYRGRYRHLANDYAQPSLSSLSAPSDVI